MSFIVIVLDITSDVHLIKTWQTVTFWDDTAQLNQYRASVKRPRSVNELLCSVKPLNRSQKVISRLSLHVLIDSDHLPEGKRSNTLNWRAGAPCDVPLPLWWRSIKRAAVGFSAAAAALVMKSWHTTARTHTLKRWKATISFLLRMFQEVKALRYFLQGSRSETQKLVSWSGPSWGSSSFSNWIFYIWMIWVVPELSNGWSAHNFEAIFTQNQAKLDKMYKRAHLLIFIYLFVCLFYF